MLGLGLRINKNVKKGFVGMLDELRLSDNVKFTFSPLQILTTAGYKAIKNGTVSGLVQIRRTSDYTSEWFGCNNDGSLDVTSIQIFLNGSDGLIRNVLNEGNLSDTYMLKQFTTANEPKLFNAGSLIADGTYFGGSDNFLYCSNYTGMPYEQDFSIYCSFKTTRTGVIEYIFTKNDTLSTPVTMSVLNVYGNRCYFKINANIVNNTYGTIGNHTSMSTYANNTMKINYDGNEESESYSSIPDNLSNIAIGGFYKSNTECGYDLIGNVKTVIVFDSDEYDQYTNLVNLGL